MLYVFMYLFAAVLANLAITFFGPTAIPFTAFFLIGLDLTSRDKLHEAWHGKGLFWKMLMLIATGSVTSYLLNKDAAQIALASFCAFAAAGVVDAIAYQYLYNQKWYIKVNGSNLFSALVDSLVFPYLAFGGLMPAIVLSQFAAKFFGGLLWSWIIAKVSKK